jgi:hypothetical protein
MLTDRAIAYLQPLTFSTTAARLNCFIPLGGIYWNDEIPDFDALLEIPEQDRLGIYKLFSIRFRIWKGEELDAAEKMFWEEARGQVPDYALFHRLKLSDEERTAQEQLETEMGEVFEAMFDCADEVSVSMEDGSPSFSATFDLTKKDGLSVVAKKPWWKRIFRR